MSMQTNFAPIGYGDDKERIKQLEAQIKELMIDNLKYHNNECADCSQLNEMREKLQEENEELKEKAEQAEKENRLLIEEIENCKEREIGYREGWNASEKHWDEELAELQKQNTTLHEMLNDSARLTDKMADGWCLVSPEDFERLQDKGGKEPEDGDEMMGEVGWTPEHKPNHVWNGKEWVDR